jgi:peptidoglycan/LPS O-acetylase OafA/YrhL
VRRITAAAGAKAHHIAPRTGQRAAEREEAMSLSVILFFALPGLLLALGTRRPAAAARRGGDPVAFPLRRRAG